MAKRLTVSILILLTVAFLLTVGCGTATKEPSVDLEKVSEFEGGRLCKAGKIYVAQLNGSYREMGQSVRGTDEDPDRAVLR